MKVFIIIMVLLTANKYFPQKIQLKEGQEENIKLNNLNISTLLQVYDDQSAAHLKGDIYLRINTNDETIVEFYIDHKDPTKEFYTKAYHNLFLTFSIENQIKYLTIEESKFGKEFALSDQETFWIGDKDNLIELEITDYYHEWGSNPPVIEGEAGTTWDDIIYTLKTTANKSEKSYSFSSSEINDQYPIELDNNTIIILSDKYNDSSAFINMIIHKK